MRVLGRLSLFFRISVSMGDSDFIRPLDISKEGTGSLLRLSR